MKGVGEMTSDVGFARGAQDLARPATAPSDPDSIRSAKMTENRREGGSTPAVTVQELIHTSVVTATPETTLASAAAAMVRARAWP